MLWESLMIFVYLIKTLTAQEKRALYAEKAKAELLQRKETKKKTLEQLAEEKKQAAALNNQIMAPQYVFETPRSSFGKEGYTMLSRPVSSAG